MAASFSTLVKKNKFGCNTYRLQLEPLFRIDINETNSGTYIFEFLELGIFTNTTLFSFTSNDHFLDGISEAMDRVANYYRQSPKYDVPEHLFVKDKLDVMKQAGYLFKR
jgi:hypothetical protein